MKYSNAKRPNQRGQSHHSVEPQNDSSLMKNKPAPDHHLPPRNPLHELGHHPHTMSQDSFVIRPRSVDPYKQEREGMMTHKINEQAPELAHIASSQQL